MRGLACRASSLSPSSGAYFPPPDGTASADRPACRGRRRGLRCPRRRASFSGDVGRSRAPLAQPDHPRSGSPRFVPEPACLRANLREPGTEEASPGRTSTYGSGRIGWKSPFSCWSAWAFGTPPRKPLPSGGVAADGNCSALRAAEPISNCNAPKSNISSCQSWYLLPDRCSGRTAMLCGVVRARLQRVQDPHASRDGRPPAVPPGPGVRRGPGFLDRDGRSRTTAKSRDTHVLTRAALIVKYKFMQN